MLRFFSARPQMLEPMLRAFELWNLAPGDHGSDQNRTSKNVNPESSLELVKDGKIYGEDSSFECLHNDMTWEERYVMLLWIYHLAGVPFDLTSLSSPSPAMPSIAYDVPFLLPANCPAIIARLVAVACQYLGRAGREREAAVPLLARLALLDDWHEIGLHRKIIEWALSMVVQSNEQTNLQPDYNCMSLISFLARFVALAASTLLEPFLNDLIDLVQITQAAHSHSPAVTKLLIKLHRNLALHSIDFRNQAVELATAHFIDQLSATNTATRLASSKALARVALELDQDMVMDLVGHLLVELERDVNLRKLHAVENSPFDRLNPSTGQFGSRRQLLENVNASRWHGLIMALSHLIYQHSIRGPILADTMDKLISALHFCQTNALGSLIGSNVRDAACFGFWALSRKYSTAEVTQTPAQKDFCFQTLANELVVVALLDPVGNVRRAASAALQEMIGRHPDTIECGQNLELVRIVDFHTVGSKPKATNAAMSVIEIGNIYWSCLLQGLFSWRGARFEDNGSRQRSADENQRSAALLIGTIAIQHESTRCNMIPIVYQELKITKFSKIAERRGLIYALAGVISRFGVYLSQLPPPQERSAKEQQTARLHGIQIASIYGALRLGVGVPLNPRPLAVREIEAVLLGEFGQYLQLQAPVAPEELPQDAVCLKMLSDSLNRLDEKIAIVNGKAIKEISLSVEAQSKRKGRITAFLIDCIEKLSSTKGFSRFGYLAALSGGVTIPSLSMDAEATNRKVIDILVKETRRENLIVELRTFSINRMKNDLVRCDVCTPDMRDAFEDSLHDYTVDKQKGDVGQHIRKAAISAIDLAISRKLISDQTQLGRISSKIQGLAMDKVGGVRFLAISFLKRNEDIGDLATMGLLHREIPRIPNLRSAEMSSNSSQSPIDVAVVPFLDSVSESYQIPEVDIKYGTTYFERLLALMQPGPASLPILEGIVVTAGSDCEGQIDSRTALIDHLDNFSDPQLRFFWSRLIKILRDNFENDRLLLPAIDVVNFLFESGIMFRIQQGGSGQWNQLFDLINRHRFKSTNVRKLEAAVRVYCNLAGVGDAKVR